MWIATTGPKGPRQGKEVCHRLNIDATTLHLDTLNGIDESGNEIRGRGYMVE